MNVTLTWSECEQAAVAGVHRRIIAMADNTGTRYGEPAGELWRTDIESCGAELAVAKTLGLYWTPWARNGHAVKADLGENIQVRHTASGFHLLMHPRDNDDHLFVLVTGRMPTYHIAGWIMGYAAKANPVTDPHNSGRPAIWVPADQLAPISDPIVVPA